MYPIITVSIAVIYLVADYSYRKYYSEYTPHAPLTIGPNNEGTIIQTWDKLKLAGWIVNNIFSLEFILIYGDGVKELINEAFEERDFL